MSRKKLEDAESRLLRAGLSLFAKHGTERVNSNRIAKSARLGIGTFYSHFPDKHALLRKIESRTLAGIQDARLRAIRRTGGDPNEQVRATIQAAVDFAGDHPEAYRVTFGRERAGASRRGPIVSESSRPTAEALRQLQAERRIPADLDVDLAARAYLSMEVGTLLWWLEDQTRARPTELAKTLACLHPLSSGDVDPQSSRSRAASSS